MSKLDPNVQARTLRIHVPTYEAIKEFASRSPDGISANELIRQILFQVGLECQRRLDQGETLNLSAINDISKLILKKMES